jgi:glycine oxidase
VKNWDVIIVGGGIIGLSLALELREGNVGVLVLDSGEPGKEASSAAAGMLAGADPETPTELRQFATASAELYPEFVHKLEAASGIDVDFRRQGTVALFEGFDAPPIHRKLSQEELRLLEPALQPGRCSAFFLAEDSVDPDLLMQAAINAVHNAGVEIRSYMSVQQIYSFGSHVEMVAGAERFAARVAVNCRGAWAGVPVRPRKGQMCYLLPQKAGLLSHVVRAPQAYLMPRSSGQILVGATLEDVGFDKSVEAGTVEKLCRAASELVPELASATVVKSWAGLRPGTPDNLPIMGEVESGILISSGHFRNGILLAPLAAKVMAELIMGKPATIDIVPFSPARFAPAPA